MRLLGFSYSPFVAKVRKCLELKGLRFSYVEVPYLDRRELLALTGGSIHVPVLEDAGTVVSDSARITAWLDARYGPNLRADPMAVLVEGWADNVLEDTVFRIACPRIEPRLGELLGGREDARAVWRLLKERKFGPGCLEAWSREAETLNGRAVDLLEPVARVVASRPFLLGDAPSLADAAVFGQLSFLELSVPGWIALHSPALSGWFGRVTDGRA